MTYLINAKEAKQLNKQGYSVVAGEYVNLADMPEWLQKRADNTQAAIDAPKPEKPATYNEGRPWKASELKSLARALGRDRDEDMREILGI